jgi:hypothetical protein
VPGIRYHSLAARHTALPTDFVVTSTTAGTAISAAQAQLSAQDTSIRYCHALVVVVCSEERWADTFSPSRQALRLLADQQVPTCRPDHRLHCVQEITRGTAPSKRSACLEGEKVSAQLKAPCAVPIPAVCLLAKSLQLTAQPISSFIR